MDADALKVGPREKLAELARGLVTGAAHEAASARLFFIQRHEDLLDEESRKTARDFRLGLESLMAQGKADGSVKAGAAEVWAGVWLGVVTLVIDRVSAKEWPETHAGVTLALDGAWDAVAAGRARFACRSPLRDENTASLRGPPQAQPRALVRPAGRPYPTLQDDGPAARETRPAARHAGPRPHRPAADRPPSSCAGRRCQATRASRRCARSHDSRFARIPGPHRDSPG